jgi:hypothetical protein
MSILDKPGVLPPFCNVYGISFECRQMAYRWIDLGEGRRSICQNHFINFFEDGRIFSDGDLLYCPSDGICRIDRGRAGGAVQCAECGKLYYDHPQCKDFPFLNVLCDGSLVKL